MRAIRSAVSIGASASHTASGPWRSIILAMASLTTAHHPRRDHEKLAARPELDGATDPRGAIGDHAAMSRDDYERHLARDQPGLYESHYLTANSGDGGGLVGFRRGDAPRVWKREVPVSALTLSSTELALRGDRFRLDRAGCEGQIGDASGRLAV